MWVIIVPVGNERWNIDHLASGMYGSAVFTDWDAAEKHAVDLIVNEGA